MNHNQAGKLRLLGFLLLLIGLVFVGRLFYLQVLKSSHYRQLANSGQVKSLQIEAKRGQIYGYSGDQTVPLVLNERRWLIFSDTQFVDNPDLIVSTLSGYGISLSGSQQQELRGDSRYIVLAKSVSDATKHQIDTHGIRGVYFREQFVRSYPEGALAAHVLGFINADSHGQYGVEQLFNQELTGIPGQLRAVTDTQGVPLVFEESNIALAPQPGQDVILTLDVPLQQATATILRNIMEETEALSGSVVILDAKTGAVKTLTNYPTFEPEHFNTVTDHRLFRNSAISDTFEPGSVIKTLIMAAALDSKVVGTNSVYDDPVLQVVDGEIVKNAINYGAQRRTMSDILVRSLNTGAIYLLKQLGSGEINQVARQTYYDYLTKSFRLGQPTGIDLPSEEHGLVVPPNQGDGLNIRYANMTFGQGLTVTLVQLAAVYSALFNGGVYYQPYVVHQLGDTTTQPDVLEEQILSADTLLSLQLLMQQMGTELYSYIHYDGLEISGKTGTAEIAGPNGYIQDEFTGVFTGYVKSREDTFVIAVRVDRPQVRFAGTYAAVPIYKQIVAEIVKLGKVTR